MKSKNRWILHASIITIVLMLIVAIPLTYQALNFPDVYPLLEISNIEAPFLDLQSIEKSLKLEPKADEDDPEFMMLPVLYLSNWYATRKIPWSNIETVQNYQAYSLEDGSNLERNVYLNTDYYLEKFPFKVNKLLKDNQFAYVTASEENVTKDERFDKCYVNEFDYSLEGNWFRILVIKSSQIMYLEHRGGNLTPDDFLDELDRIL